MDFKFPQNVTRFLINNGWADAKVMPLAQDASTRRYFRLHRKTETAILMSAGKSDKPSHASPELSGQQRAKAGYASLARLAENDCGAFACLARALSNRGFSAPIILDTNMSDGLILLEDLGDDLFAQVVEDQPELETELYTSAIMTLAALCRSSFDKQVRYQHHQWQIQDYDLVALKAETDLFRQWYLPFRTGVVSEEFLSTLDQAWAQVLAGLEDAPPVLVLRDYHAQNLIWLPKRDGFAQVGLLDFQDAVFGHPAYDLVSLLQDARRDVSPALETKMIDLFIQAAKISDQTAFLQSYSILGAQRAAKILGIFVRLAERDGKGHYLSLLPRVERLFAQNLNQPALAPLHAVLQPVLPDMIKDLK